MCLKKKWAKKRQTHANGQKIEWERECTVYVFFQLIAFQMIYNTANYALDFDFCNEFTFGRQRKRVMNGRHE